VRWDDFPQGPTQLSIRGLNKDHNRDLKGPFRAAATRASVQAGPFQDFYQRALAKGKHRCQPQLREGTLEIDHAG
jgi:hypothetical protein